MVSRHDSYASLAVVLLAIGVAAEAFRLLVPGGTWPGYSPLLSRAVSATFIGAWSVHAVALLARRRHRVFASSAWVLSVLSPFFMVAHAAITRIGGSYLGLAYVPLAAALGFALKRTFDRGARTELPTRNPGGRVPGAEKSYRLIPRPRV